MTSKAEHSDADDEMKRKFQEALAHKGESAQARKAQEEGRKKVGALQGPSQKRTFRRKTG